MMSSAQLIITALLLSIMAAVLIVFCDKKDEKEYNDLEMVLATLCSLFYSQCVIKS